MIEATNIGIIMNQVRTKEDRDLELNQCPLFVIKYFGFHQNFFSFNEI